MAVEGFGCFVLGIHQDSHGRNVRGGFHAAAQGVHEQEFPHAHALHALIDGQPTKQRHRELRVTRQLFGQGMGQFAGVHRRGGQRVVPEHLRGGRLNQNEGRGDALVGVLAGLLAQVAIQRRTAAAKAVAVMALTEGLDAMRGRRGRQSPPHLLAVGRCGLAQTLIRRGRVEQSGHERDLLGPAQADRFVFPKDARGSLLGAGDDEFAQGAPG